MTTINQIESIITESENMRGAFFFRPHPTASARRAYEKKHSHEKITWMDGADCYTAEYVVTCTCNNVYAHGHYTRNGLKTTLTAVKNSLARMKKN